jgi:hypothetical protein
MPLEPVILFFLLGLLAGLLRSDLKIPAVLHESLSIFLLLAIGLKGGVELARQPVAELLMPALVIVAIGAALPLIAFPLLQGPGRCRGPTRPRWRRTTARSAWSPLPSAPPT